MPMLIKDGVLCDDHWTLVNHGKDETVAESNAIAGDVSALQSISGKNLILPLKFWQQHSQEIAAYEGDIAVWLDSDEDVNAIGDELQRLPLVALNFPLFTDGRPYSKARQLRRELAYEGEIRAVGDVLRDQLFYMSRCGFNAFLLRHDQDPAACLAAFKDFKTTYAATTTEPLPLFRRR